MNAFSFKNIYFASIFLMMCSFYNLSFTWSFHRVLFSGFATICSIIYMNSHASVSVTKKTNGIVFVVFVWYLFASLISPNVLGGLVLNTLTFIPVYSVIKLSIERKKELLSFICVSTSLILVVSLVGWCSFLLGFNLPHTYVDYVDDFHHYINYYLFIMANRSFDIIPRFNSVFIEPGQMASVCVLILLSKNVITVPKRCMHIVSLSLFLSFSLAGWLVYLLGRLGFSIIDSGRKRIMQLTFITIAVGGLYIYAQYEHDSVLNTYIFDRLVLDDEKVLAGNNRTHDDFNIKYADYIETSDAVFGIHKELAKGNNWTIGNAGYKVFIVVNGLFGLFLVFVFVLVYYRRYPDKHCMVFLIIYVLQGSIRSFWVTPYWLIIYILALPLFHYTYTLHHYEEDRKNS